jgi:hypothetical protein
MQEKSGFMVSWVPNNILRLIHPALRDLWLNVCLH